MARKPSRVAERALELRTLLRRKASSFSMLADYLFFRCVWDSMYIREWWDAPKVKDWWQQTKVCWSLRPQNYLENLRMKMSSFWLLHTHLQPKIQKKDTPLRKAVPSDARLAIFLWRMANSTSCRVLGQIFGVGKATVSQIVIDITYAMCATFKFLPETPVEQLAIETIRKHALRGMPNMISTQSFPSLSRRQTPSMRMLFLFQWKTQLADVRNVNSWGFIFFQGCQ